MHSISQSSLFCFSDLSPHPKADEIPGQSGILLHSSGGHRGNQVRMLGVARKFKKDVGIERNKAQQQTSDEQEEAGAQQSWRTDNTQALFVKWCEEEWNSGIWYQELDVDQELSENE